MLFYLCHTTAGNGFVYKCKDPLPYEPKEGVSGGGKTKKQDRTREEEVQEGSREEQEEQGEVESHTSHLLQFAWLIDDRYREYKRTGGRTT